MNATFFHKYENIFFPWRRRNLELQNTIGRSGGRSSLMLTARAKSKHKSNAMAAPQHEESSGDASMDDSGSSWIDTFSALDSKVRFFLVLLDGAHCDCARTLNLTKFYITLSFISHFSLHF